MVIIENDLYGISARLKEIDGGYFIVYNKKRECFEVHSSSQAGNTYCLTVPYKELDARTVSLVKSTRKEYMDNVLRETERENAEKEAMAYKSACGKYTEQGEKILGRRG